MKRASLIALVSLVAACASAQWAENRPPAGTPHSLPPSLFPPDNPWHQKVINAPADPNSATLIAGWPNTHMNYDFGNNYGFPWTTVSGDYPCVFITKIHYDSESDHVCVPIPAEAHTQNGWSEQLDRTIDNPDFNSHDRHMLIYDVDHGYLYEIYQLYHNHTDLPVMQGTITVNPGEYYAASVAFWDAKTNNRRPDGWTSSTAGGLQLLPGILGYDEATDLNAPPIDHAFRTTMNFLKSFVYYFPASHATQTCSSCVLSLGMRLRLKPSVPITQYGPHCQRVLTAMKTYGLIYDDTGGQMYISGHNDMRWGDYNSAIRSEFLACLQGGPKLISDNWDIIQLNWGKGMSYSTTPSANGVQVAFGADALVGGQSCSVLLKSSSGTPIAANTVAGGSSRQTSFSGLSPSTPYQITFDCGHVLPEPGDAIPALTFTTTASNATIPNVPGQPNVLLEVKP